MNYKDEKILCIIYHDRIPFTVYTEPKTRTYPRLYEYDFDVINNDMMFSLTSSSLFRRREIKLPKLATPQNPPTTQIWLEKGIKTIGDCSGIKILKHPIVIKTDDKSSRNPFKISA